MQTRVTTTIRTAGVADLQEEIEFFTKAKLAVGEVIGLKTAKPIVANQYGQARVVGYLGPGRDQNHRKYVAVREV